MRSAAFGFLAAWIVVSACFPAAKALSRPREEGWVDLMKPEAWKRFDPGWIVTSTREVKLDPDKETHLKAVAVKDGNVWLNGEKGRLPNLITKQAFGDCEIHVEFLIANRSNAGIKFHEVYEIQMS
jgi:3-keto-disaccharide hydrolase